MPLSNMTSTACPTDMKSSRNVALLVITLIAIAGIIGWQLLGDNTVAQLPDSQPAQQTAVDTKAKTAATAESNQDGALTEATKAVVGRESVTQQNPGSTDLPSIIGQVVDVNGRPAPDVEITCINGAGLGNGMPDLEIGDAVELADNDLSNPQTWINLARGNTESRTSVRTDESGNFRIRAEGASKKLRIRALSRGHLIIEKTAARPVDRDIDVGVLKLSAAAIITGRVVDVSGSAVAGAFVTCSVDSERNRMGMDFDWPGKELFEQARSKDIQETDASGRFAFYHASAGKITFLATHADYPNAQRQGLSVAAGNTLADVLITMPRSGTIRGTVVDLPEDLTGLLVMASKKPKPASDSASGLLNMFSAGTDTMDEMGFSIAEAQCPINADGSFALRGLDADSKYRVWVGKQGRGFAGSNRSSKRVEAPTDSNGVTLRYEAGINVKFVVVDAKSGAPIENLWINDRLRGGGGAFDGFDIQAFAPGNNTKKSYPDGQVTVANLRPKKKQTLQLTISAIGYDSLEQKNIELPAEGSLDIGILKLDPKPTLQVTVLSAYGNQPIEGARVRLTPERRRDRGEFSAVMTGMGRENSSPRSSKTNEDGECTLNALVDQPAQLKVTRRGYATAMIPVLQKGDASDEQIVRMITGGKVVVTVLDEDKQPLNNIRVEHRTPEGNTDNQRTDKTGTAQFTNLTPDLHEFRLSTKDDGMPFVYSIDFGSDNQSNQESWQAIEVLDEETAQVVLTQSPTASITGFVRENGIALKNATVTFQKGQGNDRNDLMMLEASGLGEMMGRMGGGRSSRSKTADDGSYSLTNLPVGEHTLRVTHKSRAMPTKVLVTVNDGENRFLDIDLITTTLRGIVQDSDGNPISGAKVSVSIKKPNSDAAATSRQISVAINGVMSSLGQGAGKLKTNANGEFELRGVAADVELEVNATAAKLSPSTITTSVGLGQTKGPITLTLTPAGRIEVRLAKSQMFAAIQAKLVGESAGTTEPIIKMIQGKKGFLDGLRPGTWEVSLMGMGMNNANEAPKKTVNVIAGETITVEL